MCNLFPIPERSKEKIHPNSINKFEPVLDPDTHRSGQFKLTLTRVWIKDRRPAELLSFNVVKIKSVFSYWTQLVSLFAWSVSYLLYHSRS